MASDERPGEPLAAAGDEVGPYRLIEPLGRGGHGEVWRAEQLQPVQRTVAVKLLQPRAGGRDLAKRFAFERQALARLDHPDIARILDAGTWREMPYLVVELAPGEPITKVAADLPIAERVRLFARVVEAVGHAHGRGLIHCDLKGGNVLVWQEEGETRLKVIDFGIARLLDDSVDSAMTSGTPATMSPEQAAGGVVDVRSDVYALGLLLHALLGGENPVLAATTSRGRRALAEAAQAAPRPAALPVPPELNWIIDHATRPAPTDRYATANELLADVSRYLDGRPTKAGPGGRWYRLRKHAWRNKALTVAAALVVLSIAGGIAAATTQAVRASRAEDRALVQRDAALAAEAEAEQQARAAEATSRFLQRILFSARPGMERPDQRAAFVRSVDRARKGLETDLTEFPEVRAELLDMIGLIYLELGRYEEAGPLLLEGWRLRGELFGEEDRRALRTRNLYAQTLLELRQMDEGLALIERGLTLGEAAGLGPYEDPMPKLRANLATALAWRLGPGDVKRLAELAGDAEAVLDDGSFTDAQRQELADLLARAADALLRSGDPSQAAEGMRLSERAMQAYRDTALPRRQWVAIQFNHAKNYQGVGRPEKSIELYDKLLPQAEEVFGEQSQFYNIQLDRRISMFGMFERQTAGQEEFDRWRAEAAAMFERTKNGPVVFGPASLIALHLQADQPAQALEVAQFAADLPPGVRHYDPSVAGYARQMAAMILQRNPDLAATTRPAGDEN